MNQAGRAEAKRTFLTPVGLYKFVHLVVIFVHDPYNHVGRFFALQKASFKNIPDPPPPPSKSQWALCKQSNLIHKECSFSYNSPVQCFPTLVTGVAVFSAAIRSTPRVCVWEHSTKLESTCLNHLYSITCHFTYPFLKNLS